jgi:signal transduction histidine kinase
VWIQLLSNLAIGIAYIAIAVTLVYMVRRIEDLPFKLVYMCFAVFIVTCGFTHFMDAYVIWNPVYWIDGGIRIVTAIASVGTAVLLPPLIPDAVALARGARAAHRRGVKLEEMVEDLEKMYEQVTEIEQLKTDFFANVSHELRTPLQLILGPAERLVANSDLDAEDRGRAETIVRNGKLLLKHVNDLLDVASMEAGRLEVVCDRVDVAQRVRRLVANFETMSTEREVDCILEIPEEIEAEIDADKFDSILLNLLSNAFKFTPAGGTIRCTVGRQDGRVRIEVADSGPGVAPEEREVIFERFRQLHGGSAREFGGTGLGLVICRDFVELHKGTIMVDEAPEGGALFVVELPIEAPEHATFADRAAPEQVDAEPVDAEQIAAGLATRAQDARRDRQGQQVDRDNDADKPVVLVVEDNVDMSDFIVETLQERYRTVAAYDGRQGLDLALEEPPDLILSDLMMPRMSGDQMVRKIRAYDQLDAIPIMLLTAKADDALRLELLREGAQDYLMKPFETEELLTRVSNQVTISRTRKLLQEELRSTRRDLERLVAELAQSRRNLETSLDTAHIALERAEQASKLKSEFLGMVSHELRTPVAALQLQLMVLHEETDISQTGKDMLSRMSSSMERLTHLIESLLHRASIESGKMTLSEQRVDPQALANAVVEEVSEEAEHRGLELRLEVQPNLGGLETDPQVLRLVLLNLVRNALRYTKEGHVEVRLARDEGHHLFCISDTGPGIAPEDRVRLFAPFERGADARQQQLPGAGLGLALVRDLTEALGGKIELESEVGFGSSFTVVLPTNRNGKSVKEVTHE